MGHYSERESSVRVDFFKPSGKWYCTEAIDMIDVFNQSCVVDAVASCVIAVVGNRLKGMWSVCLDPYHPMGFPLMFKIPE